MPRKTAVRLTEAAIKRHRLPGPGERLETPDALAPGLLLRVTDSGRRDFLVRYRVGAKQGKMAIGQWPGTTLAEARDRARDIRGQAASGVDPKAAAEAEAAKARLKAETFGQLAEAFLAE